MKIKIQKFGPIENAEVEFAPLLLLTGDSNLGKSYVNYLMYYVIYSLNNLDVDYFISQKVKRGKEFVVSTNELQQNLNSKVESFMRDFLCSPDIECKVTFELLPEDKEYRVHYTQQIVEPDTDDIFDGKRVDLRIKINARETKVQYSATIEDFHYYYIQKALQRAIEIDVFGKALSQIYILPPARGAYVGENYTMKERISSSVGMYRMFLQDYDRSTQLALRMADNPKTEKYRQNIEKLLDAKLITRDSKQYMKMKTGDEIPLTAAASSVKELSPLLYALQGTPDHNLSFCLEEPEAHLHPKMQIQVSDLIADCLNDGMIFQITTHSDYVIQRINQLIKLDYIYKNKPEAFAKLCNTYKLTKDSCIDADKVKGYFFSVEDGRVKVENLNVTEKGIPMVTFFEVVAATTKIEDDLNNAMEQIAEKE